MSFLNQITSTLIDASIFVGKAKAHDVINKLCKETRKNNRITIVIDICMVLALLAVYLAKLPRDINIMSVLAANLVMFGRVFLRIFCFIRDVYKPYGVVIKIAGMSAWKTLLKERSLTASIKTAIKSVMRYYYKLKTSAFIQDTVVPLAEENAIISPIKEIEDNIADEFCPIIRCYLIEGILPNFIIFTVTYGAIIFVVRHFFLQLLL